MLPLVWTEQHVQGLLSKARPGHVQALWARPFISLSTHSSRMLSKTRLCCKRRDVKYRDRSSVLARASPEVPGCAHCMIPSRDLQTHVPVLKPKPCFPAHAPCQLHSGSYNRYQGTYVHSKVKLQIPPSIPKVKRREKKIYFNQSIALLKIWEWTGLRQPSLKGKMRTLSLNLCSPLLIYKS